MKYLVILALLSAAFAQTQKPKHKTLAEYEKIIADQQAELAQYKVTAENLLDINRRVEENSAALAKRMQEVRDAANDLLKNDQEFSTEYTRLLSAYNTLVKEHDALREQHNHLLDEYISDLRDARRRERLSQLRLPAYQPYYLPPPVQPMPIITAPKLNFNCTTDTVQGLGNHATSFTTCN